MAVKEWLGRRIFNVVHRNHLVYNTCWEDPRLDRVALDLGPADDVLVISSAGCNALDYALCGPNHVFAVDMNPRQNALLELKIAAIRHLDYDDFFRLFGQGRLPGVRTIYSERLRGSLSDASKAFWDKRIGWFDNRRRSFYYRGTAGVFARVMTTYADKVLKIRPHIDAILNAPTVEAQQEIYRRHLAKRFWTGFVKFAISRDTTLSMLGVPKAQRRQIELYYQGGLVKYVQDCVEGVFCRLPLADNYFWRVYLTGQYTPDCCPEYLKRENFEALRAGLVDRISTHTASVQSFLDRHSGTISRLALLDHMDWLSDHFFPLLEAEWQGIVDRARPGAKLIWRSGGLRTDYLDQVSVQYHGRTVRLPEILSYNSELAQRLHARDRVHTYASFYIATLNGQPA
jgi:S-adenosylmethionine-diacylglycerol 3-amino-3-carboxypropyl transferase